MNLCHCNVPISDRDQKQMLIGRAPRAGSRGQATRVQVGRGGPSFGLPVSDSQPLLSVDHNIRIPHVAIDSSTNVDLAGTSGCIAAVYYTGTTLRVPVGTHAVP